MGSTTEDCFSFFSHTSLSGQQPGTSPQHPRAPAPTPAGTPLHFGATKHCSPQSLSLSAESILIAFDLAHEQLRSAAVVSSRQAACSSGSHTTPSPVVTALSRLNAAASRAGTPSSSSPAVKTTRQVPSVLAAVAQLEAAQKGEVGFNFALPAKLDSSRFQTPPVPQAAASSAYTARNSNVAPGHAVPAVTQLANPLYSPGASAARTMLTPYFTPLGMDDTMDSCVTPLGGTDSHWNSRLAAISSPPVANSSIGQWRENLAGRLNTPVSGGLATPGSAGSGVVTVGWRSVTERLQALRVQLQSAQKKLASTAEVGSAGLLITCF